MLEHPQGIAALISEAFLVIILLVLALNPARITAIVASLNTVNSQVWAYFILVTGLIAALLFHKNGLDIAIAAGVIGAAVNMFNSLIKPQQPGGSHLEVDTTPPTPPITPALTKAVTDHVVQEVKEPQ